MNVLSCFDGMSCGRIALERAGIKVDNYFASEIDKYAMQIATKNYPDTKHIGSVVDVKASDLPKIDLLIGGSPCQGFSFAGKQLNFEDERSKLFFEYVRLLEECKPKYFLLENVKMKKEYQDLITKYLGVEPIKINSALVSAQNRERLYWTNIPNIAQLEDRGLLIRDILDYTINDVLSEAEFDYMCRSESTTKFVPRLNRAKGMDEKSNTLTQSLHKGVPHGVIKRPCEPKEFNENSICHHTDNTHYRKLIPIECERLQTVPDNYTDGVSNSQRYKMLGNGWTVDVIAHIFKGLK